MITFKGEFGKQKNKTRTTIGRGRTKHKYNSKSVYNCINEMKTEIDKSFGNDLPSKYCSW